MTDSQRESSKPTPEAIRIFKSDKPSSEDLVVAQQLSADACPRRYCWWWKSLSFEWDVSVPIGCTFLQAEKPKAWKNCDVPCFRSGAESDVDHFEPRDAQLIEDHIDGSKWQKPSRA
jgi:hypothetical protein